MFLENAPLPEGLFWGKFWILKDNWESKAAAWELPAPLSCAGFYWCFLGSPALRGWLVGFLADCECGVFLNKTFQWTLAPVVFGC